MNLAQGRWEWQASRRRFLQVVVGAFTLARPALAAPVVLRFPYLQEMGETAVTVMWTMSEEVEGALVVTGADGEKVAEAKRIAFPAAVTGLGHAYYQFEARVTGLTAGTAYRYKLLGDGVESLGPIQSRGLAFRTPGEGPFAFLHFGDSGTGDEVQATIARQMSLEDAAMVIANGDLAYPDASFGGMEALYFSRYAGHMARVPFFASLGNHEYYTEDAVPFLASRPADFERYYSFDWGNVHFVCLDSNGPLMAAAAGAGRMLEWLDKDLAATRKFWRIAFFHHPGYATGDHENEGEAALVRSHLAPVLERHGVQLVLNGHEHSYQRSVPLKDNRPQLPDRDGTVHITSGGAGAPPYAVDRRTPIQAFVRSINHYLRCEVDGEALVVRAIAMGTGEEFDRLRLAPRPVVVGPVVDSASFGETVAQGALISVFGRNLCTVTAQSTGEVLPLMVAETSVRLAGRALPIVYACATQLNLQIPFDAAGEGELVIRTPNGTDTVALQVKAVAPALFGQGGQVLATRGDGSAVGEGAPAKKGERVMVWLTGLGDVRGPQISGRVAGANLPVVAAVRLFFNDTQVTPIESYAAMGYAGIYHVSCVIPEFAAGSVIVRVVANDVVSNSLPMLLG